MTANAEDLDTEIRRLEAMGPRLTGSDAHRSLVESIASQLQAIGLAVHRDGHVFMRWSVPPKPEYVRLQIEGEEVEVSSAFPYSGMTGREGLTAPLRFIPGFIRRWSPARGAIAVVEVPYISIRFDVLFKRWDKKAHDPSHHHHPVLSALLCGPWLRRARDAGVRGVICVWRGLNTEDAKNQYLPFWQPYHDLPAVWVAGELGERVIAAARQRKRARLFLDATLIPNCKVETVWAVSRGTTENETILILTHTDGTNVVEENGHIALLELARHAERHRHHRTFVYVFGARHMRIPGLRRKKEVTAAWLESHPDLWAGGKGQARAVAGLVIEHLGAKKGAGKPAELQVTYATTHGLYRIASEKLRNGSDVSIVAPRPFVFLGEGVSLHENDIPTIALLPQPQYLIVEGAERVVATEPLALVDIDLIKHQIENLRELQDGLDTADVSLIGKVRQPRFLERVAQLLRIVWLAVSLILRLRRLPTSA